MTKKWIRLVTVLGIIALQCQVLFAGNISFTNFTFTTIPYGEALNEVARMNKEDNEQRWYVTLTGSSGLSSTTDRALVVSGTVDSVFDVEAALVPIRSTTTSFNAEYYTDCYLPKGTNCKLYATGNQNMGIRYTISLSGRYTP